MAVELHRHADRIGGGLDAEDAVALGVKDALGDEVRHRLAGLERRVELDQGLRPERATVQDLVDVRAHPRVPDRDEAAHVVGVVRDQLVANGERIHSTTPVAENPLNCIGSSPRTTLHSRTTSSFDCIGRG